MAALKLSYYENTSLTRHDEYGFLRVEAKDGVTIRQSSNYSTFGAPMPGRQFNNGNYRYGFNGKENDNEVKGTGNQQDYGMRIYDPRLGKFLSVDPITDDYPELTPYQFAENGPIEGIDLDGLEKAIEKSDGTFTTARDGRLERSVPPEYLSQFELKGSAPNDLFSDLGMQTMRFLFEKIYIAGTGEDFDGNEYSKSDRVFAGITVIGNLGSGGKGGGVKGGGPKFNPKIKPTNSTQVKTNANSKSSTKPQVNYRIKNTVTNKYVKPGISSGKVGKDGIPYRANNQVNKWNKKAGKDVYKAEKTNEVPEGPGAREKALDYEKKDAELLQKEGHLNEPDKHKTPR